MWELFRIIIVLSYISVLICLAYNYIKSHKKDDNEQLYYNNWGNSLMKGTPLHLIRNQYFPHEQLPENDFYINTFMLEVFNIFIKLSPSMIATLTKAARRMVGLQVSIENPMINEDYIKTEIEYLNNILDELVKVSHTMIEKLESHLVNESANQEKVLVSKEVVKTYMNAVNILMDLTDNHATLNYEIHGKLVNLYPDLIEPFRIVSGKITYLFFINLISYSNKIDENIFIS